MCARSTFLIPTPYHFHLTLKLLYHVDEKEDCQLKDDHHAKIQYTLVERKIDYFYQLQKIATKHELVVTKDEVITASTAFGLHQVLDVSYKPFSSEAGILYLHTNQGVFPFHIHSNPSTFIETFRSFK